ncbi:peptidyl-prolyl cis-trans isomerase D [Lewinella aquimaris]|uniref:Periplasmic chaperone PpiD n=1 Tax=Neolewinella aquimaris TaxID=1835722 RepID=A0A840E6R7_9BACT|nr:SurA N-terminal domain-containing protein [Neolewinella aquimaris]MBB4079315.1 peptidyl-prolyl cis-trans isomerase D [Neolewinella aquimaris]
MALIGKIRSNPILVLLFIGGGILLFVLSDIMNSGNSGPIGPAEAVMARVGEVEIERNEFERTLGVAGSSADAYQSRDNLWNFYLSEGLIRNETDRLGLTVTKPELDELTYGPRYSPVIRQTYGNRQTGQVDAQLLNRVRTRIDENSIEEGIEARELPPNFVDIWKYQNRQVSTQRLQEKLSALVSKAMYAPSWMAQEYADQQSANRRVAVVRIPFDELDNDEVEYTDADLQAYIDENRSQFDNLEETRQLAYVSFNVDATQADSAAVRALMQDIANEWKQTEVRDDSLFALAANGSYTGAYVSEDQIAPSIADALMNEVAVGEVYGPFVEGQLMAVAKLIDRREMADSVTLRRIVRNASIPSQFTEANRLIDSLQTVLEADPSKFTDLASEFNRDPQSIATAGVLENIEPGQLAQSVDRLAFITGEPRRWYKVTTPTGVQLIQIIRRSQNTTPRVKVAYATEPMIPSSETEDAVRAQAEKFLTGLNSLDEMRAAAEAQGVTLETTAPLDIGTFFIPNLGSGQDVRDMICWAFGADRGDVSGFVYTFTDENFFYENKYVAVGLANVLPKGMAPVEAVRETIENTVRDRMKGRKLAEAMAGMDLNEAARTYDTVVDTLNAVNLTLSSLPQGIGAEPKVIAAASTGATNQVSQPIVGNNGVYLVKPLSDAPAGSSGNLPGARMAINTNSRSRVSQQLLNGLRAEVDVEDQRISTECNNRR